MNSKHGTDFVYGRDLVKKLLIAMAVCCVGSFLFGEGTYQQAIAIAITAALFITAVVCIIRFCRCPHCGKVIFLGMLAIDKCPRCHYNLITGGKTKKHK